MNKDLLDMVCQYLDLEEFHILKEPHNLSVDIYCKNVNIKPVVAAILPKLKRRYNENEDIRRNRESCDLFLNALSHATDWIVYGGYLDLVKYLIKHGNTFTRSAIDVAARTKQIEMYKYLVSVMETHMFGGFRLI